MRRTIPAAPYLVADVAAIDAEPWRTMDGEAVPHTLQHWDVSTTLRLERRVTLDLDSLSASTGLVSGVGLATRWRSDLTRMRQATAPTPLDVAAGGVVTTVLSVEVPGHRCGGKLELETMVVLTAVPEAAGPLSAKRVGSVLWRARDLYVLEGEGALFPTTDVDFNELRALDPAAAWALEWSPDQLDRPVRAGVRLLLNSRCAPLMAALRADPDEPIARTTRSILYYDVARSLIQGALASEELHEGSEEFEPDSVGRMLLDLLDMHWPGTDARVLARRWRETPHRLEAELQARTGLFSR
jgi:hypothetical protein